MVTKTNKNPSQETSVLIRLRSQAMDRSIRPKSEDAFNFYMKQIQRLNDFSRASFQRDRALHNVSELTFSPGTLLYFKYNAITPGLKYWDEFPMTLIINAWHKNGLNYFDGLNFHYLPPDLRYELMKKVLEYRTDNRYDKYTKLAVTYESLLGASKMNEFSHAYKVYRLDQVQSDFKQVELKYIDIAVNLPLAQWRSNAGAIRTNNKIVWSNM